MTAQSRRALLQDPLALRRSLPACTRGTLAHVATPWAPDAASSPSLCALPHSLRLCLALWVGLGLDGCQWRQRGREGAPALGRQRRSGGETPPAEGARSSTEGITQQRRALHLLNAMSPVQQHE